MIKRSTLFRIWRAYGKRHGYPEPHHGESLDEYLERVGDCGDSLYAFICRDLDDADDDDVAVRRCEDAIDQIKDVMEEFEENSDD